MTIKKTVLNNGSRVLLVHMYLANEGTDAEFTNYNILGPEDYDEFSDLLETADLKLSLTQVWHSFSGFDGLLSFDFNSPLPSWALTQNTGPHIDFRHFGGIADRYQDKQDKDSSDRKGVVLLTTKGFEDKDTFGTMILEFRKNKV